MRGVSEMHLSVQTIRTGKKVFTKQQEYLEVFSETCFYERANELQIRNLHRVDFEYEEKVDMRMKKWDIEKCTFCKRQRTFFSVKTTRFIIHRLFEKFGFDGVFGRSSWRGTL